MHDKEKLSDSYQSDLIQFSEELLVYGETSAIQSLEETIHRDHKAMLHFSHSTEYPNYT